MNKEQKGELNLENREIADMVADEILEDDSKFDKKFLIFLLIFIMLLVFLLSSVSFAIFNSYDKIYGDNVINSGSVLFSFEEDSNYIRIINAVPISDETGKLSLEDNHYFDFRISVGYSKKAKRLPIYYEISLIPYTSNSLSSSFVRVYLTENGKDVSLSKDTIVNFSDLKDSKIRSGAKVLLTRKVSENVINDYRLRLWLSDKYEMSDKSLEFKCKVAVNTYSD